MNTSVSRRKRQRVFVPKLAAPVKRQPPRDAHLVFRAFCTELADDVGFRVDEVYECWSELAALVEFEAGWPRSCAESAAMGLTKQVIDKRWYGEPS